MDFTHFNPQSQKEEDFLANFVARRGVLEYLLRQLRLLEPSRPATHHLIVAPRGYGKTSLLRRVAIAVRTEPDLKSRLIALSFREEQHNVISLDVFWRNCLQSLLEVREDENATDDEIARLDAAWDHHVPRQALKREDQDGEPAKQEFNMYCERLGRRPLLLIDNLDALLAGLPETHQWSLRNDLQSAGGPILIAAASRYPESTHDQKAAFYDFFRIQTLDKLDDHEVMHCLRIRAENRGAAGKKVLDLIENSPGRVASLNTLAGGNPRTLGVLYSVLESHASADVLSQLSAMLDTFTGWYQARTEELPIQSRAVFDALALNWDPMTAAALGEATGLDTTMVSSQLSRLEKSGYVETVSLSGRKKGRNGYQVSERFFNIWYLMRNGPRRARLSIKFLAVFLQSCFSPKERHSIARAVLQDGQVDPGYALALASGIRESRLRNRLIEHADIQSMRLGSTEEYGEAIKDLRNIDAHKKIVTETEQSTSPAESVEALNRSIARLSGAKDLASRVELAKALFNKGFKLGELGKSKDEIKVYDDLVERFAEAKEAALREQVASALFNKGFRLGELGKSEDEIKVYDDLVERFGEAKEVALREQVARALFNKGTRLGQLGKTEDELKIYDDLLERFGETKDAALREQVAMALFNKGVRLGQLGKSDEEIKVYDNLLERFGEAKEAALREGVARALFNKGLSLGQLGKSEDEIKVYDDLVERFGEAKEVALREPVARVFNRLGNLLLERQGNPMRALKAFEDGLAKSPSPNAKQILHTNYAYALALHTENLPMALVQVAHALADEEGISASARDLLKALNSLAEPPVTRWQSVFEHIGAAVEREDELLWTNHLDDLQRLLWYVVVHGQGTALRQAMETRQYPMKFSPLYHAFVAAIEGEDHLLKINPETRQAAMRIYEGLARRLKLYPRPR